MSPPADQVARDAIAAGRCPRCYSANVDRLGPRWFAFHFNLNVAESITRMRCGDCHLPYASIEPVKVRGGEERPPGSSPGVSS